MERKVTPKYRLPTYKGGKKSTRAVSTPLQVSPSQLAQQKTALLRQSLSAKKSKDQLEAKLRDPHNGKDDGSKLENGHLDVYENIPKGLTPKEYQEWAQEWLPRLSSRKGARVGDTSAFALGHIPALVKGSPDKDPPPENISGPLVYHFNTNTTREKKTDYLDLYMDYHMNRSQSARSPRKRFIGPVSRKQKPEDPKWEFLRTEEEQKAVQGAKLEIPAWQTNRNTPDTTELNHFLENVKDKTYFSFCQLPAEKEREKSRTATPRTTKSKSAGVKLERLGLRRNKLGILEPPQKLPYKKGSLRQGHSFDINTQKVKEFEPPSAPKLDGAIIPINKKTEDKVFLTEEDPDVASVPVEKPAHKGKIIRNPTHRFITKIPTDSGISEDAAATAGGGEAPMDVDPHRVDSKPGFVISGSKLRTGSTPGEAQRPPGEADHEYKQYNYSKPVVNGTNTSRDTEMGNRTVREPMANGTGPEEDIADLRVTKSREIVIRFSKDDMDRIESIQTVTSEKLVINND